MKWKIIIIIVLAQLSVMEVAAQRWSVKTNLLSDALTVPSLGTEFAVAPRWTFSCDMAWMPARVASQHFLRTLKLEPELHYWFRAPFTGPFVGPSLSYRPYNMGGLPVFNTRHSRTQGWLIGGGCVVGWHFFLSPRWGLEPSVTLGYAYADYKRYDAPRSLEPVRHEYRHYVGPVAACVQLIYMIK